MALTDVAIRALKSTGKLQKVSDGEGLQLWVMPHGSKLWRYAYRYSGTQKSLAFGAYPEISLADARKKRDEARTLLVSGKVIFSSHHSLFFNVMCNEVGRRIDGEAKITHKRYFLHRPGGDGAYTLQATDDTPFFHHVATLAELLRAADPASGKLYTFHFNALRSIMEKTASFFGHPSMAFCLKALGNEEDRALFNRALNLLSHGAYAIHEPTEMGEDNKELFRRILREFIAQFDFALPGVVAAQPVYPAPAPAAEEAPAQ